MPKFFTVDNQLYKSVEPILSDLGIDLDTVIKMTLKRIVREQDISFLTAKPQQEQSASASSSQPAQAVESKMIKSRAVPLFEAQGFHFNKNVTFASKNASARNYWANPYFSALDSDWFLILNDWQKHELHLFIIPAHAIDHEQMVCRGDQKDKIDLQISYSDPTFTDNRSKISFAKYLAKTICY